MQTICVVMANYLCRYDKLFVSLWQTICVVIDSTTLWYQCFQKV